MGVISYSVQSSTLLARIVYSAHLQLYSCSFGGTTTQYEIET